MSYYSTFKKRIRASGHSVASAGNTLYLTIYNWENFSVLNQLIVTANNAVSSPTFTIVNHSGEDANSTNLAMTWGAVTVGSLAESIVFDGLYVEDLYRTNCLYIKISAAAITPGTVFNITAIGEGSEPSTLSAVDKTPWLNDISFKNFVNHPDNSFIDYTRELKQSMNPYGFPVLQNSTDKWYMASFSPITNLFFNKPQTWNTAGVAIQYWNGAWTNLPTGNLIDGTSNNDSSGLVNLAYSGVMRIIPPADWVPTELTQDPEYAIQAAVDANLAGRHSDNLLPPQVIVYGPQYWLRMSASSGLPMNFITLKEVVPANPV